MNKHSYQIEILEQAIKICNDYSEDKYNLYKGYAPYTGKESESGNTQKAKVTEQKNVYSY